MKKFMVIVLSCVFALGCFALAGCGSSTPDKITTGADGITNLDADGLNYVYDNDIVDLGMSFDEVTEAMGGEGKLMTDDVFSDNVYCYYTEDGQYNICLTFADRDGVLCVCGLSNNLP